MSPVNLLGVLLMGLEQPPVLGMTVATCRSAAEWCFFVPAAIFSSSFYVEINKGIPSW